MLPNLFIVGAMRCGTTSLFRYFRQHPQIMMAAEKEGPISNAAASKLSTGRRPSMPSRNASLRVGCPCGITAPPVSTVKHCATRCSCSHGRRFIATVDRPRQPERRAPRCHRTIVAEACMRNKETGPRRRLVARIVHREVDDTVAARRQSRPQLEQVALGATLDEEVLVDLQDGERSSRHNCNG